MLFYLWFFTFFQGSITNRIWPLKPTHAPTETGPDDGRAFQLTSKVSSSHVGTPHKSQLAASPTKRQWAKDGLCADRLEWMHSPPSNIVVECFQYHVRFLFNALIPDMSQIQSQPCRTQTKLPARQRQRSARRSLVQEPILIPVEGVRVPWGYSGDIRGIPWIEMCHGVMVWIYTRYSWT